MRASRILPLILAGILVLVLALVPTASPSETPVDSPVATAPSATPNLPACATEDGAGMAECWWDAKAQGNGKGTSMVSGDCALDITKDERTQSKCINVHHNGQEGPDMVAECNDIENRITEGIDKREDGWTLYECYKAVNGE